MNRKTKVFTAMLAMCVCLLAGAVTAEAKGLLSIAVDKSSMNVGDTLVITVYADNENNEDINADMKITYDTSMLEYVSSSASSASGGGGSVTATGSEIEYTFKAVGSGTAAITAEGADMTAAGVKVQVSGQAAASTDSQNSGTSTTDTSAQSASDNVSQDTADSASSAEGDATADGQGGATQESQGLVLTDDINAGVSDYTDNQVNINNTAYFISTSLDGDDIPEGFTVVDILYNDQAIAGVNAANGAISMLYLVNGTDTQDQGFYVYDSAQESFYQFVRIDFNGSKLQIIRPVGTANIPDGYTETSLNVSGKQAIAYTAGDSSIYLLYMADTSGSMSWYRYDSSASTLEAVDVSSLESSATEESEDSTVVSTDEYNSLSEKYNSLNEKYTDEKNTNIRNIAILIFVIAVLVIIIINLLLKIKDLKSEYDDELFGEDDDEVDDESEDDDFVVAMNKKRAKKEESVEKTTSRKKMPDKDKEEIDLTEAIIAESMRELKDTGISTSSNKNEQKNDTYIKEDTKENKYERTVENSVVNTTENTAESAKEKKEEQKKKGFLGNIISSMADDEDLDDYEELDEDDDIEESEVIEEAVDTDNHSTIEKANNVNIAVRQTVMKKTEDTILGKREKTPEFKTSDDDEDLEFLDL